MPPEKIDSLADDVKPLGLLRQISVLTARVDELVTADAMQQDFPDPAPGGFQTTVNSGPRRGPTLKLKLNQKYQIGDLSFRVEKVDGDLVTVKLSTGDTTTLHAPAILFSSIGLREG